LIATSAVSPDAGNLFRCLISIHSHRKICPIFGFFLIKNIFVDGKSVVACSMEVMLMLTAMSNALQQSPKPLVSCRGSNADAGIDPMWVPGADFKLGMRFGGDFRVFYRSWRWG